MPIKYGQIKDSTFKLLDDYSSRGNILAPIKTSDYNFKVQQIVNESIYELASTTAKLPKTLLIPHNPIKNTLADDTSSIRQHLPTIDFSISLGNARSCALESTGPATIVIEETNDGSTYTEIETITIASTVTTFTEYKRLISPSLPTNTIRLRFTGDFVYLFRNYVLYSYSFPDEASIPSHSPWRKIATPTDFLDLNYVEIMRDARQYLPYSNLIKTPENELFVNNLEQACEFRIHYWRKPTLLTFTGIQATDDALEIDLRDDAALIIAYNVAGTIQNSEESGRGNDYLKKYTEKRMNLISSTASQVSSLQNLYSW
jgi:hypothetical protein